MTIQKIALAPIKNEQASEPKAYELDEDLVAHIQLEPLASDEEKVPYKGMSPTPKQLRRKALAADVAHVQKETADSSVDPLHDEGFTTDVLQMRKQAFSALATHVHRAIPADLVLPVQQAVAPVEQKKKKKGWLMTVLRFAGTILLFALLFKNLDVAKLGSAFLQINPSIALVGLVVGVYTLVVSAYQWQCLLNAEKIPLDLTKLINLYMVGIAFNHFLPTSMGGDAVKIYYVGRESRNMPGSASAAVMSRITGFFGMLLVAYPALLIFHEEFTRRLFSCCCCLAWLCLLWS